MNVLVATDGSKHGGWGLNWTATLPFVKPPQVTVLHVLDIASLRAPFRSQPVMVGIERYIQEEIQRMETRSAKIVKEATQQLAELKFKGTVRKEQGAIAPVILKRAPKRDGLLVVGSQGLDALDRFMLGSVSTKLIHHATCPVLVVKSEAAPLRRIALAIDGSSASAKALSFVLTKFRPNRSTGKGGHSPIHVSVIHVMLHAKYPEIEEANRTVIERTVQKLIKAGFTADPVCRLGKPSEEIMKAAATQHADLIVMGAKGLGAIARFLLGSVSTQVVQQANRSVLVVR
jgi:nucleotide-binding universal stress UspA family protein